MFADLRPAQWSKLIFNATVNSVAALTGLRHDHHFADEAEPGDLGHLVHGLVDEGKAVAAAAGIELYEDSWEMNVHATQRGSAHYPSMLEHVESRRPTEIDLITGSLVREAGRHGVPVPLHTALYRLVKAKEESWRDQSPTVKRTRRRDDSKEDRSARDAPSRRSPWSRRLPPRLRLRRNPIRSSSAGPYDAQGQHGAVRRAGARRCAAPRQADQREGRRRRADRSRSSTCDTQGNNPAKSKACAAKLIGEGRRHRHRHDVRHRFRNAGGYGVPSTRDCSPSRPTWELISSVRSASVRRGRLAFSFGNVAQDEGAAMAEYAYKVKHWKTALFS